MRAIVFDCAIRFRADYPEPVRSGNEALIRVCFAGICATDLEITKGYMGFKGVPGHEFSGIVEQCDNPELIGKRVTGEINISCGACPLCMRGAERHCPNRTVLGILNKDGVFADYVTLPEKNLHVIPDGIADEEAVFIEPLAAAFEITGQVKVGRTTRAAVIGDGRLGLIIAQALSLTGCDLLALGHNAGKLSILEARGIRTKVGLEGLGRMFDLVVDAAGSDTGFSDALSIVRPGGTVVLKTTAAQRQRPDLNKVVIDEITVIGSRCGPFGPAIKALSGGLVDVKPLISKVFDIEDGVEALKYAAQKGVLKALLKTGK